MMKTEAKLLVKPQDIKPTVKEFRVRGAFNPAAVRLPDKKILLYARIAETPYHDEKTFLAPRFTGKKKMELYTEKIDRKKMNLCPDCFIMDWDISRLPTISHLRKILLDKSGMEVEKISQKPDFYGLMEDGDFGVEDPRITFLKKEKRYAMTYVSVSMSSGVSTSLATSANLNAWKRHGIIFRQQNKDVAIFPEKINGYYAALHRPEGTMIFDKPSIWVSYSKDLLFWGKDRPVLRPRNHGSWDDLRIGAGPIPIRTDEGWLEIYHGVRLKDRDNKDSAKIYNAGAVLLGLKNPEKVIARTPHKKPLFGPDSGFEKSGFKGGVVFPTGIIQGLDKKSILVFSGGADSNISVRKLNLKSVLNSLE